MARASCLGPAGSYSELAAKRFLGECGEVVLCRNFSEAIALCENGETDCAVIPIENSIQGGVLQNLDLLEKANVFAVEELVLGIDHRLATLKGVRLEDITKVYSHEQAIGQCAAFLRENLPAAQCIFTSSTAESLSKLDKTSAGIVGSHVQAAGVELSAENIADETKNFTHFFKVVKRGSKRMSGKLLFFCAVCKHEPGSLVHLLGIFASYGKNMTRIESRPIKNVPGEYRFFIELEGDGSDPVVQEMLEKARQYCLQFRILGNY